MLAPPTIQYDYRIFGFHRLGRGIDRLAVLIDPIDLIMNGIAFERDELLPLAAYSV